MSTPKGEAFMRHADAYLRGVDPNLALVFREAMKKAGYPDQSAALALEGICADFLAGNRAWKRPAADHRRPFAVGIEAPYPSVAPIPPDFKVLTDEKIAEQENPNV